MARGLVVGGVRPSRPKDHVSRVRRCAVAESVEELQKSISLAALVFKGVHLVVEFDHPLFGFRVVELAAFVGAMPKPVACRRAEGDPGHLHLAVDYRGFRGENGFLHCPDAVPPWLVHKHHELRYRGGCADEVLVHREPVGKRESGFDVCTRRSLNGRR